MQHRLLVMLDEHTGKVLATAPIGAGHRPLPPACGRRPADRRALRGLSHQTSAPAQPRTVDYTIADIPWAAVNIARFQIDATHSNAYTAAGARLALPAARCRDRPRDPASAGTDTLRADAAERRARERTLSVIEFDITPFTTLLYWLTPSLPTVPAAPKWTTATREEGNIILRWEPSAEPFFFTYEVVLLNDGAPDTPLSPLPLRSALWIDTAPPPGPRHYGIRTVSASGIAGPMVMASVS